MNDPSVMVEVKPLRLSNSLSGRRAEAAHRRQDHGSSASPHF